MLFFILAASSLSAAEEPKARLIRIAPELAPEAAEIRLGDDLAVRPLREGFWLHASTHPTLGAANGLLAPLPEGGVLLVDTAWNDDQTERLLAWAEASVGGVREALVTHSHPDRMGGLGALRRHGIRALALDLTAAKARAEGHDAPDVLLTAGEGSTVDPRGFEVFYPGPGHTVDNVVVAFPAAGIVDGGCLVKSASAKSSGYAAEAFLAGWPAAIAAVESRYPEADVIVPGHGTVGGRAAFARTVEIAEAALAEDLKDGPGRIYDDVPAAPDAGARWLIYLHGAIVERQGRDAVSPDFGRYEYDAILEALAARGFQVVSEIRGEDAGSAFVDRVVEQVGRLRAAGVPAERITIVGASLGGFLALEAAARLGHPGLSVVVLAGCGPSLGALAPDLRGRVLSIYDAADRSDRSCQPLLATAAGLSAGREIVLHLGVGHGLLYRPRAEWLDPVRAWPRGATELPGEGRRH